MNLEKKNWMSYHLRHWVDIKMLANLSPETNLSIATNVEKIIQTVNKDKKNRFFINAVAFFLLGIFFHYLFCVNTTVSKLLNYIYIFLFNIIARKL